MVPCLYSFFPLKELSLAQTSLARLVHECLIPSLLHLLHVQLILLLGLDLLPSLLHFDFFNGLLSFLAHQIGLVHALFLGVSDGLLGLFVSFLPFGELLLQTVEIFTHFTIDV
jgi:hypothetical protein